MTGNTVVAPGNADILLIKMDPQGNMLWQHTYGGPDGAQDYGVALTTDQYGNIYVSGVVSNISSALDVVVLKYAANGSLVWSQQFNGAANLYDVPSSMALGEDGSLYIAGTTYASASNPNYLLWKLNVGGAPLWHATYDHVGLIDVATGVTIGNNGDPMVTGGSASSLDAWDCATVKYNGTTGAQVDLARVTIPGLGLDNALAFTRDNTGNVYLTGFREVAGAKDLQTVKLNTAFDVAWVRSYDYVGRDDEARALDTDNVGNTYVCGSVGNADGGTEIVTIKYDAFGNEAWVKRSKPDVAAWNAQGRKVVVTNDGGVIVLGTVYDGTSTNFRTIKYKADGKVEWTEEYDKLSGNEQALDLLVDNDKIYVSGTSQTPNGNGYVTVKYASTKLDNGVLYNSSTGAPLCMAGQVLVAFHPQSLDLDFINNRDLQFASLGDVVSSSISDAIGNALGMPSGTAKGIKAYKVHRDLTSTDTISISRLGEEVRVPPFWSTLLLELPMDTLPELVMDQLNALDNALQYAQPNFVYQLLGDPLYPGRQQSLTPVVPYAEAGINIEPAWAITTGRPEIKVGIVDEIVQPGHPDFNIGSSTGSRVVAGKTYWNGAPLSELLSEDVADSHGAACAGIIGAIRNNEEGIAGIAGGNAEYAEVGCSLITLGIANENGFVLTTTIAAALREGSNSSGQYVDFGCHVLNNSYGAGGFPNELFDHELRRAIEHVHRNQCVFVAARGNDANLCCILPSGYTSGGVLSVGASGPDGSLMTAANGGHDVSYGGEMDIIAPGASEMITSTASITGNPFFYNDCAPLPANYTCFSGSSAAAAHTSGVAALLLSEHNQLNGYQNNLSPEDVEQLIEKGATDIIGTPMSNPNYATGFDSWNGWGRLNAGEAVRLASTPYRVYHSSDPTSTAQVAMPPTTHEFYDNQGWNEMWGLLPGTYQIQEYRVTHTYTLDLGLFTTVVDLPGSPGFWGRRSGVLGVFNVQSMNNAAWEYSISGTVVTVTGFTNCFKVSNLPGQPEVNRWIPGNPDGLKTPWSLHLLDAFPVGSAEPEAQEQLSTYPNPSTSEVTVRWHDIKPIRIEVVDELGKVCIAQASTSKESGSVVVPIEHLARGIYVVRLVGRTSSLATRFIKR